MSFMKGEKLVPKLSFLISIFEGFDETENLKTLGFSISF